MKQGNGLIVFLYIGFDQPIQWGYFLRFFAVFRFRIKTWLWPSLTGEGQALVALLLA
jgi:hypothetical protein